MGRRSSAAAAPRRAAITAASVLPGVPLPGYQPGVTDRPPRFLPPAVEDPQPAPRLAPHPTPRRPRPEVTLPPAGDGTERSEDGLVRARVLVADPPAVDLAPLEPAATLTVPFPPPWPAPPVADRPGGHRHRATDAPRNGHGAGAMLVLTGFVIAVLGLTFTVLVLPGVFGASGAPDGPGDSGVPRVRTVTLTPPAGYRVAAGADATALAAGAAGALARLGVSEPVAAAYARSGAPTQAVAAGATPHRAASGKQAYLAAWHRETRARSVSSVAHLPAGVVGTCGNARLKGIRGAGCAFAGDEVAGLLWMPYANVAAATAALPAAVRSVRVG